MYKRQVQEWKPSEPKTAAAAKVLGKLGVKKALVVDAAANDALARSVRNLRGSDFLAAEGLNVYDIQGVTKVFVLVMPGKQEPRGR